MGPSAGLCCPFVAPVRPVEAWSGPVLGGDSRGPHPATLWGLCSCPESLPLKAWFHPA